MPSIDHRRRRAEPADSAPEVGAVAPLGRGEPAYSFGGYRFYPRRQLLLRGASPVRVGTRALDLLRRLVESPGELVTKDELVDSAWPNLFVHESNLKVTIGSLRRALQATPEAPFIATVPGRGYRFVEPVSLEADTAPDPAAAPDEAAPGRIRFGRDREVAEPSLATGRLTIVAPGGLDTVPVAILVLLGADTNLDEQLKASLDTLCGEVRLLRLDNGQSVMGAIQFEGAE